MKRNWDSFMVFFVYAYKGWRSSDNLINCSSWYWYNKQLNFRRVKSTNKPWYNLEGLRSITLIDFELIFLIYHSLVLVHLEDALWAVVIRQLNQVPLLHHIIHKTVLLLCVNLCCDIFTRKERLIVVRLNRTWR